MKKIYCIIINYKSEDVINEAIASLDEENLDFHITILDNSSTDLSFNRLKEIDDDRIEIICAEENLGFAGGCNYAFKYIQNKYNDAEYIFLFNPDAIATKNLVGSLLNIILTNPNIAAISPRIVTMNNKNWFTGTMIDWKSCRIINNPKNNDLNQLKIVDIFNGCAVLMDAKKFSEVGMFDDELFLYYDEAFLSMRFKEKGYDIYYLPTSKAYHHVSYSAGGNTPLKTYYMTRNHIYFFTKYYKNTTSFLCRYKIPIIKLLYSVKHLNSINFYTNLVAIYHTVIHKKGIR